MLDINYVSMIKGVSQLFVTFGMIDPIIKSAYNENSTRRAHIHILVLFHWYGSSKFSS